MTREAVETVTAIVVATCGLDSASVVAANAAIFELATLDLEIVVRDRLKLDVVDQVMTVVVVVVVVDNFDMSTTKMVVCAQFER
jgi:hypothetical protein